jgi:uncharacterized protein
MKEIVMKLNVIDRIAIVLLIIGGLNWGLVGLFNYNLVGSLFGQASGLSRAIYALVGVSAVYSVFILFKSHGDKPDFRA